MVLNRQTSNKQRPLEFSKLFQIFHFEKGRSVLTIESGFNTGVNNSKVPLASTNGTNHNVWFFEILSEQAGGKNDKR